MYLNGEALVGEGNEVAHIDLLIWDKSGPVGLAFANALVNQVEKHTPLFAVIAPNLVCKPITMLVPKVSIRGMEDAARNFGPAQKSVAMAVADCVEDGTIPRKCRRSLYNMWSFHPSRCRGWWKNLSVQLWGNKNSHKKSY